MAFDPTPWFVGGGAQHSPEIARLVAYLAAQGGEGVVGSGDLKVSALATPGSSVNVSPGAASILARHSGSAYQSYAARMPTQTSVSIAATDAAGGRSDLIVARVEDPFAPGTSYTAPTDPTTAQYVFIRVISGVAAGTTTMPAGETGIPLARIDIPVSTSAITNDMIVDLRTLPNPRRKREIFTVQPDAVVGWTTAMADRLVAGNIEVPEWATAANVRGDIAGLVVRTATANVFQRTALGSGAAALVTPTSAITEEPGRRTTMMSAARFAIPASMRGTTQSFRIQGYKHADTTTVEQDTYTTAVLEIEFVESVV